METHAVIVGEVQYILSVMRQNNRFRRVLATSSAKTPSAMLIQGFYDLRDLIGAYASIGEDFDRLRLVKPFLDVVRSETTSGLMSRVSLRALCKFVENGLFHVNALNALEALSDIVKASSNCRFEAADPGSDEIVFMMILEIHKACLVCKAGRFLSKDSIWDIFKTTLKIFIHLRPPEYSELLRNSSQLILLDIVRNTFRILKKETLAPSAIHPSNESHIKAAFDETCLFKIMKSICSWSRDGIKGFGLESMTRFHADLYLSSDDLANVLPLRILLCVLEECGQTLMSIPALWDLLRNDVCLLMLQSSRTNHPVVLCWVLRLLHQLVATFRSNLKMQVEVLMNSIYMRLASAANCPLIGDLSKAAVRLANNSGNDTFDPSRFQSLEDKELPHEIVMVLLDGILSLSSYPWLFRDIYVNYDCDPFCSNLFHNLIRILCHYSFPVDGGLGESHLCALKALEHLLKGLSVEIPPNTALDRPIEDIIQQIYALKASKDELSSCLELFNANPIDGIETLVKVGLVSSIESYSDIATILRNAVGISKELLGEFLSKEAPLNTCIRNEFIKMLDFTGLSLDDALRMLLETFRLTKEAQQIDRVIHSFAQHFFSQNSSQFANSDAVHVLTFAMLLLNTDAHSNKIKTKMTLEQFLSLNRGINGGTDFSEEYLTKMYLSITQNEIKISSAGLGGEVNSILWMDLIRRDSLGWGSPFVSIGASQIDRDLFDDVWSPVMAALFVSFNVYAADFVWKSTSQSIMAMVKLAESYSRSDVVDELVLCLFQISGLFRADFVSIDYITQIGMSHRVQVILKLFFKVVHEYGNLIRSGWSAVISILFQFLALNLLEEPFYEFNGFVGVSKDFHDGFVFEEIPRNEQQYFQSILSSMSFYFSNSQEDSVDSNENVAKALTNAKEYTKSFDVIGVVDGTKYLEDAALASLFDALFMNIFSTEDKAYPRNNDDEEYVRISIMSQNESLRAKQMIFYLKLSSKLFRRNIDRPEKIHQQCSMAYTRVIQEFYQENRIPVRKDSKSMWSEEDVVEHAIIFLLQIDLHLISRDRLADNVQKDLEYLLNQDICSLCPIHAEQIIHGILEIFKIAPHLMKSEHFSIKVLHFIGDSSKSQTSAQSGLLLMRFLVSEVILIKWIDLSRFPLTVEIFSVAALGPFIPSELVFSALNVLYALLSRMGLLLDLSAVDSDLEWTNVHKPLLDALSQFCSANGSDVLRVSAIQMLQKTILSYNIKEFSRETTGEVFQSILFPIAQALGDSELLPDDFQSSRIAICKLLCKSFLNYMDTLLNLELSFHLIWQTFLHILGKYSKLEGSHSALTETVLECLKNVILVMSTSGVFEDRKVYECGEELYELTWACVDPVFPSLRLQLDPTHTPVE